MRELLFLRHAKSSWDDAVLDDIDRPLSGRGRRDAPRMGAMIAGRGWIPDHAIVSPARRTRQTWELVRPSLGNVVTHHDETIYEAAPEAILASIRAAPTDTRRLIVVGHNPGLEGLSAILASDRSDHAGLAALRKKFPTGALARFIVDADWRNLAGGGARLTDFVKPRDL
ncbi:histidine phosphatase family protein [Aquibium carbonis]|uniref:Histidine phosphatase family protein n=1 Tax=Aquibium carbonis TaxID=2495581 RepID=A0A429Z2U4_9HYPH|nr:histidine phosphatase family protein [Aquibium carbonis]RST88035.1 histidine phosphatase family protein [Aquibium carbonis]